MKILTNLEIYPHNIGPMNWYEAVKACEELGDGWRLPPSDSLNEMYLNRESLGGFVSAYYWSSAELDANYAWAQSFNYGDQGYDYKAETCHVRPVRDKPKETNNE